MGLFSRSNRTIGLDIGSSTVKLMELIREKKDEAWRLKSFGMVSLPPEAIVDGAVMNQNVIVDAIRELVERHKVKTKDVVSSVSGHSVIVKRINLPQMTHDELEESIQWEAEQYIPFDINDVHISFQILDDEADEAGQMEVLLVAARKELVYEYQSLIQDAGLTPAVIDVDAFAVENMFTTNYETGPERVALVNVGASSVNINVLHNGVTAFTRDLNLGGRQFTEEIQRNLNISFEEAELLKVGGNEADADAVVPEEIEAILTEVAENLAKEIHHSLDFHLSPIPGASLARIYLAGGAARTPGLARAIGERANTPIEIVDPFRKIEIDERAFKQRFLHDVAPQAAVVVGLAMRRLDD
ncbi:MAG: type IV pilus assembly protein PilM [Alphaproteobacteria bacterium]|nr:type IV pilus assembly protein PilM [Alphaproteobacteria bacterium]